MQILPDYARLCIYIEEMVNEKMLQTMVTCQVKGHHDKMNSKNKHIQNKQLFGVDFDFPFLFIVYIY